MATDPEGGFSVWCDSGLAWGDGAETAERAMGVLDRSVGE